MVEWKSWQFGPCLLSTISTTQPKIVHTSDVEHIAEENIQKAFLSPCHFAHILFLTQTCISLCNCFAQLDEKVDESLFLPLCQNEANLLEPAVHWSLPLPPAPLRAKGGQAL